MKEIYRGKIFKKAIFLVFLALKMNRLVLYTNMTRENQRLIAGDSNTTDA